MGLSGAGRGYHQNLSLTYLQDMQFSFSVNMFMNQLLSILWPFVEFLILRVHF